jgi:hypothetical protein
MPRRSRWLMIVVRFTPSCDASESIDATGLLSPGHAAVPAAR